MVYLKIVSGAVVWKRKNNTILEKIMGLESVRITFLPILEEIGKCQNQKVSEFIFIQNWKVSELESVRIWNCQNFQIL